jgi:hypothetical protein
MTMQLAWWGGLRAALYHAPQHESRGRESADLVMGVHGIKFEEHLPSQWADIGSDWADDSDACLLPLHDGWREFVEESGF